MHEENSARDKCAVKKKNENPVFAECMACRQRAARESQQVAWRAEKGDRGLLPPNTDNSQGKQEVIAISTGR